MKTRREILVRGSTIAGGVALSKFAVTPVFALQKVIRFATTNNLFMAPVFVGLEKGWFTDALTNVGYGFERREISVGPAIAEAMAAGQIDVGQMGVAVIVTAAGRGLPAKIVANTGIAGEGVVVHRDSAIKTMADLKGKTIAIPAKGNMQDFIVRRGLEKAGVDPAKDVKFVEIAPPDQKQALMAKLVDAITLWEPLSTDAVLAGGRLVATGQEIYPDHDNDAIVASNKVIAEHPAGVRALVGTIVRAQQWVMDNPTEAKLIAAKYSGVSKAVIEGAWPNVIRRRDARPSASSTQEFADFLNKWGYIKTRVVATALIDEQFLPTSK